MSRSRSTSQRRTISPDSPRKKMKDKRRVQLIEANMESIAKHGLAGTTISHVSDAAGMSRGIINFYFDSKDSMMLETLKHLLEELTEAWQNALEKHHNEPGAKRLEAVIAALFSQRFSTRKKLTVWAAFLAHAASHTGYRQPIEIAMGELKEAISTLYSEIHDQTTATIRAEQLLAQVQGLWIGQVTYQPRLDKKAVMDLCLTNIQPRQAAPIVAQRTYSAARTNPNPVANIKKPAAPGLSKPEDLRANAIASHDEQAAMRDLFATA